jgi:5'-nucleotidase/2',3'-cyclic-nucleotide 2'-phosphodiesterase/3'-nucleotidase/5'-nucleotidase
MIKADFSMKLIFRQSLLRWLILALVCALNTLPSWAAGKATADFDNARPDKGETAWGRLVADSLRGAANADGALINAGALRRGTLKAGAVEQAAIDALLSFGDDDVVTLTITGAQLRAALEVAVQNYPTGDVAFLHGSGINATFNGQGGPPRVTSLRVNGRDAGNNDNFRIAMPIGLANDATFRAWSGARQQGAGVKVRQAVANYINQRGTVSPDPTPRIAPR